jgi:hypothetical protein
MTTEEKTISQRIRELQKKRSMPIHYAEPLPKKILQTLYACTSIDNENLKGIYFDKKHENVVASDNEILVCLPVKIKVDRVVDKNGKNLNVKYPNYLAIIPHKEDARVRYTNFYTRFFGIDHNSWREKTKKAIAQTPKGHVTLMKYNDRYQEILLKAENLLKILNFLEVAGGYGYTFEATDNEHAALLRSNQNPAYLGMIIPFREYKRYKYFTVPLN